METTIYHSTNETCLKQILQTQNVKTCQREFGNNKKPGTLGFGFYGFSNARLCKKYGVEKIKNNFKFLSCDISVPNERILDLRTEEEMVRYDLYKDVIIEDPDYIREIKAYKNNKQSSQEGAMLEFYLMFLQSGGFRTIDCVIGMTSTQFKTSERSYLANGVEYCIKNRNIITTMKEVEL